MMTETFAEQNEFSFTISHPETMNDLIKYLYTGKIDYENFDEIRYASLYEIADFYQFNDLIDFIKIMT